jgi:hypothetical protein
LNLSKENPKRSSAYIKMAIRIVIVLVLGYAIYHLYIKTYLDGVLKY